MSFYALFYEVVDDFIARRDAFRDEHLRLVREAHARGEIVLAGAFANPPDGALIIFRAPVPSVAENFALKDPYVLHGLVERWNIRPWTVVVGDDPQ